MKVKINHIFQHLCSGTFYKCSTISRAILQQFHTDHAWLSKRCIDSLLHLLAFDLLEAAAPVLQEFAPNDVFFDPYHEVGSAIHNEKRVDEHP